MPKVRISPDLEMFYLIDDFTDPWRKPETILLLHGNAESSASWYAWVPKLARHFRVVRPDWRGFGASTPMPRDFPWTLDVLIDDFSRLMDTLGIERFHLVGAKFGGTIARTFAGRRANRALTLTVVGSRPPLREDSEAARKTLTKDISTLTEEFEKHGVEHWARRTMMARLGSAFPPEGSEWWAKFMGRTPVSSQLGFFAAMHAHSDTRADVARITCPTLIIAAEESPTVTVQRVREGQQTIPNSTLLTVSGNFHHLAAVEAERCAQATLEFILRNSH